MAPPGVYLMPSFDSLRVWHGVMFMHNGLYRGAIFKFAFYIPEDFPDARPRVRFHSKVFHPQVDKDGTLNLDAAFPTWKAGKDYIWHLVVFLKRSFMRIEVDGALNRDAADKYMNDRPAFTKEVKRCVDKSQELTLANPTDSSIKFTEYKAHHEVLRERIIMRGGSASDDGDAGADADGTASPSPASRRPSGIIAWMHKGFNKLVKSSRHAETEAARQRKLAREQQAAAAAAASPAPKR